MGSVTNHRLEASTRGDDLLPGLQARVHDVLWLLARQWQLGEFDGMDAGTPISATIVARSAPLAAWAPHGGAPARYDTMVPIEALVESDGSVLPWRDRIAAGLRLGRQIRAAGGDAAALIARFPIGIPDPAVDPDADPAAHASSAVTPAEVAAVGSVFAGRVADPDAVAAAIDANLEAVVTTTGKRARAVLTEFRQWWSSRQPRPSGAWQPADLEYGLSAATAEPAAPVYSATRFGGGTLDWYSFDTTAAPGNPVAAAARAAAMATVTSTTTTVPVVAGFRGAPVGRYWQLEDARTDLGAIDTFPTELTSLLLAEFSACFAGDWYRLPVRVPYGSVVHIDALVSTDTFGVATLVPGASTRQGPRPWRMYEHSSAVEGSSRDEDDGWLLVPPLAVPTLDSAPVEEVVLLRDPAADLAWGIEHIVTNAVGRPVRRSEDLLAQGRGATPDTRDGLPDAWVWRLATSVPENWIPLLPTRGRAADDDYTLVQGAMLRYTRSQDGTLAAVPVLPASLLLRAGLLLPEREVPREGMSIRRVRRLARAGDGSTVRWTSWQATLGHGQGSSGLAYDGLHTAASNPVSLGQ